MPLALGATLCGLLLAAYLIVHLFGEVRATRQVTAVDARPNGETAMNPGIAAASNAFGFDLFQQLQRQAANKNVFFSPLSVSVALAMTYNGAAGETQKAMARTLKLEGLNLDELNPASAGLLSALKSSDPKIELAIANSLWARGGVRFKEDFLARNRQFYGAEVSTLDFGSPSAPAKINDWVKSKTAGKIDKIIDQIDGDSILFLINAIYFNGKWTAAFDKARTTEETFTIGTGRQKRHPMMPQSGKYNYYEGEKFQAVSLPYGGKRVSMYIFLPAAGSSLSEFHTLLTPESWETWMSRFSQMDGDISVPRFRVEYEVELGEALKALGMAQAFDAARADFSGMVQAERAFIGKVKHKTFAEVNEEGTEAAAVTSVEMVVTSARAPRQRFRMVVDRPFFCAIRDNQTGAVLFMGSIVDPM